MERITVGKRRRKARHYSKNNVKIATGVAWYDRQHWQRMRQVASDPERLEDSYEDWVAMAEQAIAELEEAGLLIEKVPVDTEELVAWCTEENRPIDRAARAEFAAQKLRKLHPSE